MVDTAFARCGACESLTVRPGVTLTVIAITSFDAIREYPKFPRCAAVPSACHVSLGARRSPRSLRLGGESPSPSPSPFDAEGWDAPRRGA